MAQQQQEQAVPPELKRIEQLTTLMDSGFRIPVLNIKFGLDPIIGLVPGIGEVITFSISALLVLSMIRKGASGMLAVKMVGNILIDALVGGIPVLGDVFDFVSKANQRNFTLMREHYAEGKHQGSAWGVFIATALFFLLLFVGMAYLAWWTLSTLGKYLSGYLVAALG